ncbi:hypothetical protein KPH14_012466 [Odynerus spinipes]|uniref:RNA helicase aquarius N-terminal domain-containing protein n=1 Tax=Odynerus spinipes TaxID=1348599 RepID=A0AAD9RJD4_9HYME|nr:hypothetical protein KPH14_012466 [Odynerus spinipes]
MENLSAPPIKSNNPAPTVEQINADKITQLANKYWAPHTTDIHLPFNPQIVDDIYVQEICASKFSIRRIMMLEFSQYLENFLWPNYNVETATRAHTMSIVVMVNEKFRERVQVWEAFEKNPTHFAGFFQKVLEACLEDSIMDFDLKEQTALIVFLNHCFNSMEVPLVREEVKRLVSLSMWISLQEGRRELEFKKYPKWRKYWKKVIVARVPDKKRGPVFPDKIRYCERFLELVIDLEALLPTRRFFNTVMDDCHLVVRCQLSNLLHRPEGGLFGQVSFI